MKKIFTLLLLSVALISCSSDDDNTDNNNNQSVDAPANYQFTRNGNNTVSYSGQTLHLSFLDRALGP